MILTKLNHKRCAVLVDDDKQTVVDVVDGHLWSLLERFTHIHTLTDNGCVPMPNLKVTAVEGDDGVCYEVNGYRTQVLRLDQVNRTHFICPRCQNADTIRQLQVASASAYVTGVDEHGDLDSDDIWAFDDYNADPRGELLCIKCSFIGSREDFLGVTEALVIRYARALASHDPEVIRMFPSYEYSLGDSVTMAIQTLIRTLSVVVQVEDGIGSLVSAPEYVRVCIDQRDAILTCGDCDHFGSLICCQTDLDAEACDEYA